MLHVEILSDGDSIGSLQVEGNDIEGEVPQFLAELHKTLGYLARKISFEDFFREHAESHSNQTALEQGSGIKVTEAEKPAEPKAEAEPKGEAIETEPESKVENVAPEPEAETHEEPVVEQPNSDL